MSTLINLQGTIEPMADTLRKFLFDNYPDTDNKPVFISAGGINDTDNTIPLTTNDLQSQIKQDDVYIKLYNGNSETISEWNDGIYQDITIYLDIIGLNAEAQHPKMDIIQYNIDKILFDHQHLQKMHKTNGNEYSQFTGFNSAALEWEMLGNDEISGNNGISNQYSTEIHVSVQRCGSDSGITEEEEEDSIFPGPPQNLHTTSVYASFATFAYSPPDDIGASQIIGYVVEYKPSSSPDWHIANPPNNLELPTGFLSGLSANTSYDIRVHAENNDGPGAWSDVLTFTTA